MTENTILKQMSALIETTKEWGGVKQVVVKKKREMTEARRAANNRYDVKTYKRVIFTLRLQEDADIIRDIEEARSQGMTLREWLRKIYDKAK